MCVWGGARTVCWLTPRPRCVHSLVRSKGAGEFRALAVGAFGSVSPSHASGLHVVSSGFLGACVRSVPWRCGAVLFAMSRRWDRLGLHGRVRLLRASTAQNLDL